MKQPFKFIFGDNSIFEHIGLVFGLIGFILESYNFLIFGFCIIAISMFVKLGINLMKYFAILKFEEVFEKGK